MIRDFNSILEEKIALLEKQMKEKDSLIVELSSEVMYLHKTNDMLKEENHSVKLML